ncbi:hypothetical protein B0H14DRAFT_2591207 [Mycena olivaceomarginata]|nr:hypothetical protein B0H14DRAFT_2591207 [Mycena olivaceomarginata]
MPPVPENRTLAQDTQVHGEDLATACCQTLNEGEHGRALADHVSGAAKLKAHPEGEGEDSERNPKRAREREIQEPCAEGAPAPALLRMWFSVQDQMGRIFYTCALERVVNRSHADRHTLVDKQGELVVLCPHMAPKLVSAADTEGSYDTSLPAVEIVLEINGTLYAMTQLLLTSYDALVPHTNWSSSPDTLECPRSLGASSKLSSAHTLIVRTNWSSTLDTLECLLTPGTPSEPSSTQHNKRPHPHLSSPSNSLTDDEAASTEVSPGTRMRIEAQIAEHMSSGCIANDCVGGRMGMLSSEMCGMGAVLEPTECLGSWCSIHCRDYYDFKQAGGVDGYIQVVENTLRDLGEPVDVVDIQWLVNKSDKRELGWPMKSCGMYKGIV